MIIIFFVFFLFINYFECLNGEIIKNKKYNMKGIYQIYNLFNNDYLGIDNDDNVLFLNRNLYFRLYKIESNLSYYFIESKNKKKFLGVDEQDNILIYNQKQNLYEIEKIIWKIIRIKNNFVFIKNI